MHFFLTHYRNLFAFLRNLSQVDLSRAYCPKFVTYINVRITTISSHFLTIYTNICHRTEVQIIILRYLTGLKLNWFKSYDTNEEFLLQRETEILTFCAITFEPIMAQTCSVGEKWLELVGKRPFLSSKFWATGSDFNDFFIFFRLCNGLQLLQLLETLLPFWEEFHVCHPVVNTISQFTQPTSVCTEKRMISKFRPQLWWDYFFYPIKVRKIKCTLKVQIFCGGHKNLKKTLVCFDVTKSK